MSDDSAGRSRARGTRRRPVETRNAILGAALTEFSRCGYAGATTRGIAARAGVNHALITHHFGAKEGLWKATATHLFARHRRRLRLRLRVKEHVDESSMLRAVLRDFIVLCRDCPEFHRFLSHANHEDPERLRWLVEELLGPDVLAGSAVIERAQRLGLIRGGDSMHVRYLFLGAATSIFTLGPEYQAISGQDPYDDQVLERHIDLMMALFTGASEP